MDYEIECEDRLCLRYYSFRNEVFAMYNSQLEMFIKVADAGSFNKAAKESYITPTAVIKQMNALEKSLGVPLFVRNHQGLKLTPAGISMYKDAKYVIQYCKDSIVRAKKAQQVNGECIRVGSSVTTPAQLLIEQFSKVQDLDSNIQFEMVPFENTPENAREILANLGQNVDIVGGIFDDSMLKLRKCSGFELKRIPLCVAVSRHHPLADKESLKIQDLYGQDLLLMHQGWSQNMDQLRKDILQNHSKIHIIDFDFYNMDIFNQCENSNAVLMAVPIWANAHPLLKMMPVDWDYQISYGILHALNPSKHVLHFLDIIKQL